MGWDCFASFILGLGGGDGGGVRLAEQQQEKQSRGAREGKETERT